MIRVAEIQRAVAAEHGLPLSVMTESDWIGTRLRTHTWPRQEAITLAVLLTEHSQVRIGQFFGHRDHTTILSSRRAVQKRLLTDGKLRDRMRRLTFELVRG